MCSWCCLWYVLKFGLRFINSFLLTYVASLSWTTTDNNNCNVLQPLIALVGVVTCIHCTITMYCRLWLLLLFSPTYTLPSIVILRIVLVKSVVIGLEMEFFVLKCSPTLHCYLVTLWMTRMIRNILCMARKWRVKTWKWYRMKPQIHQVFSCKLDNIAFTQHFILLHSVAQLV